MRVVLDLPDWVDERNIYVLAGIEEVAHRYKDGPWMVKTQRCDMCGRCCADLGPDHPFPVLDGQCVYLKKEVGNNPRWLCRLGVSRPLGCCISTPSEDCPIRYKEYEG